MLYGKGLRALSIATAVVLVGATALIFFYAPLDADQGVIQKIFYVHLPLAIVLLCGFVAGGVMAIQQLRKRTQAGDMRSYVAVHPSLVIAAGAFVPINFMAVRLATAHIHPRVLSKTGGQLPGDMRLTFLVALAGVALLWVTMWKLELTSKNASFKLKRLRRKLELDAIERSAAEDAKTEPAL